MRMKMSITILFLLFFIILLFIFSVVFYQVHDSSMSPALTSGNKIMVDRISPKLFGIKRGDIVVYALDNKQLVVKRCFLASNDIILEELRSIITNSISHSTFNLIDYDKTPLKKIPTGYYFFIGDNSALSNDSRDYGLIRREKIIGKVIAWSSK